MHSYQPPSITYKQSSYLLSGGSLEASSTGSPREGTTQPPRVKHGYFAAVSGRWAVCHKTSKLVRIRITTLGRSARAKPSKQFTFQVKKVTKKIISTTPTTSKREIPAEKRNGSCKQCLLCAPTMPIYLQAVTKLQGIHQAHIKAWSPSRHKRVKECTEHPQRRKSFFVCGTCQVAPSLVLR